MRYIHKIIFNSLAIWLLASSVLAQMPSEQLALKALRQREARGVYGVLTTTRTVTIYYDDLDPLFESALAKAESSNRRIDKYQRRPPRDNAEWGDYIRAQTTFQESREIYLSALRQRVIDRLTFLDDLKGEDVIDTMVDDNLKDLNTANSLRIALGDVRTQLDNHRELIESGRLPAIRWLPAIPPHIRGHLQSSFDIAIAYPGNDSDVWSEIDRTINETEKEFLAALGNFEGSHQMMQGQGDAMKKQVTNEMRIIGVARGDLARNALTTDLATKRATQSRRARNAWRRLNGRTQ